MKELLELARTLAQEAGELVASVPRGRVAIALTKSSPTDVVTEMDRAAETLIRSRLAELRPDDGIIGEEFEPVTGTSGLTWVLDPIDGTTNFVFGLPMYAVSIGLVSGNPAVPGEWYPEVGCVHAPAWGRTWSGARGLGAWEGENRLELPEPHPLSSALVATGFGYLAARRAHQAQVLTQVLPQVRDLRRIGSAAIDICLVAAGELDAYYERGVNLWDIAGAAAVLLEAGGGLSGVTGQPASPELTVAAGQPLLAELVEVLTRAQADRD